MSQTWEPHCNHMITDDVLNRHYITCGLYRRWSNIYGYKLACGSFNVLGGLLHQEAPNQHNFLLYMVQTVYIVQQSREQILTLWGLPTCCYNIRRNNESSICHTFHLMTGGSEPLLHLYYVRSGHFGPRLVRPEFGAGKVLQTQQLLQHFRLYLLIIVQTLTNQAQNVRLAKYNQTVQLV